MFVQIRFDRTECTEVQEEILSRWVIQREVYGNKGLTSAIIQIDSPDQLWELQEKLGITISLMKDDQGSPIVLL